jgi:hypothetical protein
MPWRFPLHFQPMTRHPTMRILAALTVLIVSTLAASAGSGINFVVPGRAGVPVIISGLDASYRVVEGDWGLERGTHVAPTVYGGRPIDPVPRVGHYFPSSGQLPGYGRLEVDPPENRRLPQPAESFYQSWSAQSAPPAPAEIPQYPPGVIIAPEMQRDMSAPTFRAPRN